MVDSPPPEALMYDPDIPPAAGEDDDTSDPNRLDALDTPPAGTTDQPTRAVDAAGRPYPPREGR